MVEDVDKIMETMRMEGEEPPIDDEIQAMETFVTSENPTDFKGFGAIHNTILRPIALLRYSNRSWTYVR